MSLRRFISIWLIVSFLSSSVMWAPAHADMTVNALPVPGTMVTLTPAFQPVLMKGLKVDPKNPFHFDFVLSQGNSDPSHLKQDSAKLIKYFLAALTIPEKDLWVNLSPYEKDRMIPPNLGQTEMGKDMLAQDYILKQLTASLIYPEKGLGKEFWNKVYAEAQSKFGTTNIPVNTFNKVWIVADKADVFEGAHTAYIVGAHLKVMLEEDYLAKDKNQEIKAATISSKIIKEIILPAIETEINTGKTFAPLRQMFYSMILASWYKMALKDAVLTQVYGNQSKVKVGVNQQDPAANEAIFQRYLQAYKKGVFSYIKNDIDAGTKQSTPRKYFSGGVSVWENMPNGPRIVHNLDSAMIGENDEIEVSVGVFVPGRLLNHKFGQVLGQENIFSFEVAGQTYALVTRQYRKKVTYSYTITIIDDQK